MPGAEEHGAITPMAILEPVELAGSTISKTTLHNEDFIKEKGLRIGDHVIIQKAGDVIPEVVECIIEKRTGEEKRFRMPKVCPVCGAPAEREKNEAIRRCIGIECPARKFRNIVHFASKAGMDIEGLGYAVIEALIEKDLLNRNSRHILPKKRGHSITQKKRRQICKQLNKCDKHK